MVNACVILGIIMISVTALNEGTLCASGLPPIEQGIAIQYDVFGALGIQDRLRAYRSLSPIDRAEIAKLHATRWLERYRDSLQEFDITAIKERISLIKPDLFASEDPAKVIVPEGRVSSAYLVPAFDILGPYLPIAEPVQQVTMRIIDEALPLVGSAQQAQRQERNRQHNQQTPFRKPLTERGGKVIVIVDRFGFPFLYWAKLPLIVIGWVEEEQPYLSDDGMAIYTEFKVRIEQILKNNPDQGVIQGGILPIERDGGALRMHSGQVVEYRISGNGIAPRRGSRYVLFLGMEKGAYNIIEGYEIRESLIFPIFFPTDPHVPISEGEFFKALNEALGKFDSTLRNEY